MGAESVNAGSAIFAKIFSAIFSTAFACGCVAGVDNSGRLNLKKPPEPWPDSRIPFAFSTNSSRIRSMVRDAMSDIHNASCISFQEVPHSVHPLLLFTSKRATCWSSAAGYQGLHKNVVVNYGQGCAWPGRVLHELMHALGFLHEHSRPDRGNHIAVHWRNVRPGYRSAFRISRDYPTLNVPYDFDSVMHYRRNTFAKNTSEPVLTALGDPSRALGGSRLSALDKVRLRAFYACNSTLPGSSEENS